MSKSFFVVLVPLLFVQRESEYFIPIKIHSKERLKKALFQRNKLTTSAILKEVNGYHSRKPSTFGIYAYRIHLKIHVCDKNM